MKEEFGSKPRRSLKSLFRDIRGIPARSFLQKGNSVASSDTHIEDAVQARDHLQRYLDEKKKRTVEITQIHFIMELRLARGIHPKKSIFLGWLFKIDEVHYEVYDNGEIHERPAIEEQAS